MRLVTSLTNPSIKALRGLHERKYRRQSGLFLAEGLRIVTEAIELGWPPQTLIFLSGREEDAQLAPLIRKAEAGGADIIAVNEAVLAKISRKDNPQMVLASFVERWVGGSTAMAASKGCWIALDRVRDPGNLGTILRTADAAGASGVMLIGECCDAWSVESVRASMGAIFNIGLARFTEEEFLAARPNWKGRVIGTALPASVDYREAKWQAPLMLLMGNEQAGLTNALMASADELVRMPMLGRSDSLNLAVATGVTLYEALRYRHQA